MYFDFVPASMVGLRAYSTRSSLASHEDMPHMEHNSGLPLGPGCCVESLSSHYQVVCVTQNMTLIVLCCKMCMFDV